MHPWDEVFERHLTDKSTHRYGAAYSHLLAKHVGDPISLLEVGVWEGRSLLSWRELFPEARVIVGFDINPDCRKHETDDIHIEIGDARKPDELMRVKTYAPFDIVIDDGSHYPDDVRAAHAVLWPMLKIGGIYVIEDCSVAGNVQYNQSESVVDWATRWCREDVFKLGCPRWLTTFAGELIAFTKVR